ncbi:hypothetical protein GCM10023311_22990 [Flaviramulus aquimarinus]|uniref:Uncharacterized protein n=2 Tax=Flaviramulus aquimarinus TaxID=1170456 RepID=A0ABP9FA02_9FLAO
MSAFSFSQTDRISTIDYIEVLNGNKTEALFYYQNNWKQLRIQALEQGYIKSYQLLESVVTKETPYNFILITTYKNKAQFDNSEVNFQKLIDAGSGLKLINDKKPGEFRKVIMHNNAVKHWN